jgi:hypothetical protein
MLAPPSAPPATARVKDALVVVLALLTAALTLAVWRQQRELRRLAPAPAPDAPAALAMSLRTVRARNLTLVPPRAAAPERAEPPDAAEERPDFSLPRRAPPRGSPADALARLLDNPEFFQLLALHRQAALDARFAALFRQLALGGDELAAFKRLLVEKDSVALDVVAVSESQPGGPLSPAQLDAGIAAARAQVEAAIRTALGHERYAVYRDYEQTLPQRTVVARLEQRLSYSAAPLAPAQAEALVKLLVAHAPAETPAAAATVAAKSAPPAVSLLGAEPAPARITETALVEAQAVLAPAQVAALRDLQAEQQASARALDLLRENLPAAGMRPGLPAQLFLQ